MKHNDKKAVVGACRGEWDKYPLTDEEKSVLKERYLADGSVRMTYDGISAILGIPRGRIIVVSERAITKLMAYAKEQEEKAKLPPEPTRPQGDGSDNIFPNSRQWRPWYRSVGNNEFETLDLVLAAGLMALGYRFIEIREPAVHAVKKRIVIEVPDADVYELLEKFMRQELMVDASIYHGRLKALKDMLYHKYNS